jgi:hypothetical protein
MKKLIILLVLILIRFCSLAQTNSFSKIYGCPPLATISGNAIVKTFDKGFIIVGTYATGGLIYKIDSVGNNVWQKSYDIPNWAQVSFNDIKPTTDSCFIITGNTPNPVTSTGDLVCMKINSYGDTLWCKAISASTGLEGNSIEETFDHGFIIAGIQDYYSGSPVVAVKLDSIGNLEWKKAITFGNLYNLGISIKQLPDSSYVLLTTVVDNISIINGDVVLVKLSPSGAIVWSRQYYRSTTSKYDGVDLLILQTGILSYTADNGYMAFMKTDFAGNILWSKRYSPRVINNCTNCGNSKINPVSDGGFIITNGQVQMNYTYPLKILKLDSAFNIQWSKNVMSSPVEVIETNNKGLLTLTSPPDNWFAPYFGIIKMDSLGNALSCITPSVDTLFNDSIIENAIYPITIDSSGFSHSFKPSIGVQTIIPDSGCITDTISSINNETNNNSSISIFPNPFAFQMTIAFNAEQIKTIIEITDLLGNKMRTINFTGKRLILEKEEMSAGIYFIRFIDGHKNVVTKKIIIQ